MFNSLTVSSLIKKQGGRLLSQGEPLSFLCDDFATPIKLPIQARNNSIQSYICSLIYIPKNLINFNIVILRDYLYQIVRSVYISRFRDFSYSTVQVGINAKSMRRITFAILRVKRLKKLLKKFVSFII